MLYGMDEEDELEEFDKEFSNYIEEKHLNLKKVIIAILIFIGIIAFIVAAIIISFNLTSKDVVITVEKASTNETENNQINLQEFNKDNSVVVEIPTHDLPSDPEPEPEPVRIPIANPNGPQEVRDIYTSEEKQVYLTFDDGPSPDITPQILDILAQYNVKATFFVLGARVEYYPDLLRREFNEGHYIANHGYSHTYSKIYTSKDTVFEEYAQCEEVIKNTLGIPEFNTYLFRFPGGSSGGRYEKIKAQARELFNSYGIAFTNWNCLTGDAENKTTKEACINELLRTKGNQNSLIVLMHDANDKKQTVEALPEIIEYFMNEGYTFKNFYEIFDEREEVIINEEENNNI